MSTDTVASVQPLSQTGAVVDRNEIPVPYPVSNLRRRFRGCCLQDPILGEIYARKLQNLPKSNRFSSVTGVTVAEGSTFVVEGQPSSGARLSAGAIAGIAVGAIFYVIVHVLCFYYMYHKRRNRVHHRDRDEYRSCQSSSSPPSTMAWVQPEPDGWLSCCFNLGRVLPCGNARDSLTDPDVPRMLSMPHHSKNGSSSGKSASRDATSIDTNRNLMFFMKENSDDFTRASTSPKKSSKRTRV